MQGVQVYAAHEWLQTYGLAKIRLKPQAKPKAYDLRLHCTEASALPESGTTWQAIFKQVGLKAHLKSRGCCGMAGSFGHQAKHQQASYDLFQMSWRAETHAETSVLATGFSCRAQMQRFARQAVKHPISAILQQCRNNHL